MEITAEEVRQTLTHARVYTFGLLLDGRIIPQTEAEKDEMKALQMEHLKYLFTLKKLGKLPLFGPLTDGGSIHGILIFATESQEEAKRLMDEDPYIKRGYLNVELHPYYGLPGDRI